MSPSPWPDRGCRFVDEGGLTYDELVSGLIERRAFAGRGMRQIPLTEDRSALATLMVNNRLFEVDDTGNVLRELEPDKPHVGTIAPPAPAT